MSNLGSRKTGGGLTSHQRGCEGVPAVSLPVICMSLWPTVAWSLTCQCSGYQPSPLVLVRATKRDGRSQDCREDTLLRSERVERCHQLKWATRNRPRPGQLLWGNSSGVTPGWSLRDELGTAGKRGRAKAQAGPSREDVCSTDRTGRDPWRVARLFWVRSGSGSESVLSHGGRRQGRELQGPGCQAAIKPPGRRTIDTGQWTRDNRRRQSDVTIKPGPTA